MINKSRLFKMAWKAYKRNERKLTFSKALKWAWKTLKSENLSIFFKNVVKETDKAISLKVEVECPLTNQKRARNIWVPKSIINGGNAIPLWFWNKKTEELADTFSYTARNSLNFKIL